MIGALILIAAFVAAGLLVLANVKAKNQAATEFRRLAYEQHAATRWLGLLVAEKGPLSLNALASHAYEMAKEHGWYDKPADPATRIALMHSELSEALEEWRIGHALTEIYEGKNGKPEGYPIELADCIIRILDQCGAVGIDIQGAVLRKMAYNSTRPYRHGGKVV